MTNEKTQTIYDTNDFDENKNRREVYDAESTEIYNQEDKKFNNYSYSNDRKVFGRSDKLDKVEGVDSSQDYQLVVSDEESVIPSSIRSNLPEDVIKYNLKKLEKVDYDSLIEYGAKEQKTLSDKSDEILNVVQKGDNPNSIKKDLEEIMKIFENSDPNDLFPEDQSWFRRFMNRGKKSFKEVLDQFTNDKSRLDNIKLRLERSQKILNRDIQYMDKLKDALVVNYKDTYPLIAALEERKYQLQHGQLEKLETRMDNESASLELTDEYNEVTEAINHIDKKIYSLQASQALSKQTYDQITMMQDMNKNLSSNIKDQIYNVIPTWSQQLNQAYVAQRQDAQSKLTDLIYEKGDQMLRSNAEKLQETAMRIAASSERSIVNIDTLKEIQGGMEETVNVISEIKRLGKEQRDEDSIEIAKLLEQNHALLEKANDDYKQYQEKYTK